MNNTSIQNNLLFHDVIKELYDLIEQYKNRIITSNELLIMKILKCSSEEYRYDKVILKELKKNINEACNCNLYELGYNISFFDYGKYCFEDEIKYTSYIKGNIYEYREILKHKYIALRFYSSNESKRDFNFLLFFAEDVNNFDDFFKSISIVSWYAIENVDIINYTIQPNKMVSIENYFQPINAYIKTLVKIEGLFELPFFDVYKKIDNHLKTISSKYFKELSYFYNMRGNRKLIKYLHEYVTYMIDSLNAEEQVIITDFLNATDWMLNPTSIFLSNMLNQVMKSSIYKQFIDMIYSPKNAHYEYSNQMINENIEYPLNNLIGPYRDMLFIYDDIDDGCFLNVIQYAIFGEKYIDKKEESFKFILKKIRTDQKYIEINIANTIFEHTKDNFVLSLPRNKDFQKIELYSSLYYEHLVERKKIEGELIVYSTTSNKNSIIINKSIVNKSTSFDENAFCVDIVKEFKKLDKVYSEYDLLNCDVLCFLQEHLNNDSIHEIINDLLFDSKYRNIIILLEKVNSLYKEGLYFSNRYKDETLVISDILVNDMGVSGYVPITNLVVSKEFQNYVNKINALEKEKEDKKWD